MKSKFKVKIAKYKKKITFWTSVVLIFTLSCVIFANSMNTIIADTIELKSKALATRAMNSAIADVAVAKVTFAFLKYGTKTPLSYNGLYWAKFVKNNCDTYSDIPNKFSANDVVSADCKNGEVYLNNTLVPALGALGNDWEEFYLSPGINQIGFSYSDWVNAAYAPKFKIRYREVFL